MIPASQRQEKTEMQNSRDSRITLWIATSGQTPRSVKVSGRFQIHEGAVSELGESGAPTDGVTIEPLAPLDGAVAAVFVADDGGPSVALNGIPIELGLYPMRATDRLDIGPDSYWLAEDLSPRRTRYDPDQHGADARCCMTKARLQPGQDIVLCPGCPGSPCHTIYKAAAWDAVMQAGRDVRCPSCGYRPEQAGWRPPNPRPRKPLDEFSHFLPK
jgi:hypothetical protein